LAHDKITVDEPLISTDVDSLIRTLSERRRMSLEDLKHSCKIDTKTMEKWLAVLEDEGYINVEYGIRGTFVNWIGLGMESNSDNYVVDAAPNVVRNEMPKQKEPAEPAKEQISEPPSQVPESPAVEDSIDTSIVSEDTIPQKMEEVPEIKPAEEYVEPIDADESPEPEELLSEYLARKKEKGSIDIDNLRAAILTKLDKEDPAPVDAPMENEPEVAVEEETEIESESEPDPEPPRAVREQVDVRELMNAYLSEINSEKEAIEALRREKETIYQDKFNVIEGKMQSDVAVLSEKIIEKQSRIAELKERVLELPDKVDDLNRLQNEMDRLKKEGRMALERTKRKADEFIGNITSSRSTIEERIGSVTSIMDNQFNKVQEFEGLTASLDAKTVQMRAAMENAQIQVQEIQSTVDTLKSDLALVEQMKTEIYAMTDAIRTTVANCGEELSALEAELEGIEKMEHWVQEYVRDYETKVDEIEAYISRSDDDLAELKSASEAIYMKEYLEQLESLTEDYQNALAETVSREQDIDEKISVSKSRITELVRESQDMIRKVKSGMSTSVDYNNLLASIKQRTSKIKAVVAEKQSERSSLNEDTRNTRKTVNPVAAVTSKAKSKPAPKAKTRPASKASKSTKKKK
jgi:chromosome segregation ATPase